MAVDEQLEEQKPPPETASEPVEHSALMDGVYRRQRYIYDATRKYFLLGRDQLLDELRADGPANVLEVGCGTGRNLILAARRYPNARFYGFDISEMMLETARANIERAGLSDRITLAQGDATTFSAPDVFGRQMDRVFLSYTLSMIPPWREAVAQSLTALTVDGTLHVVDFGQQEQLPEWSKKILGWWLAKFHVSPRPDLSEAMHEAAAAVNRASEIRGLYKGYAWIGRIG
ncbi:MAG: class I SAM-dependent methyltransferase [Rhodobacteraceae bacterium]|nr:class I SAM-dependent methyltransferase [Paracoccaceae bacterium]